MHVQPEGYSLGNRLKFDRSVDVLTNISTGRVIRARRECYIVGNRVTFENSVNVLTTSVQGHPCMYSQKVTLSVTG